MSITVIIVIVVMLSLIIGPMMLLRPNLNQKQNEQMRSLALTKGVHYSMRNIPRQADEMEPPPVSPVYFLPPVKTDDGAGWMLIRANYAHDLNFLGSWVWHGDNRATPAEQVVLRDSLPKLPDSIRAVSAAGQGASVYWNEKGGEVVLEQVLRLLASLKQAVINPE